MAIASAAGMLIQAVQVGLGRVTRREVVAVSRSFLGSGRWMALTNLGTLCMLACGTWPLTYFHGRASTADFFAIAALLKVCNPVIQSVGGMIVPAAAKAFDRGGMRAAARISLKMAGMAGLVMAPFVAFLFFAPGTSLWLAFHGKYSGPAAEAALRLFAFSYVNVYLSTMLTSFLNGVHRSRYTFYGQVVGSICMVTILLPMNVAIPVTGFIWGGIIQTTIQIVALVVLTRRAVKESHAPVPAAGVPVGTPA
jgi:O-antigen/teichoic acid export membrane protein